MATKQKMTYGSWKSPITTDLILNNGVGLGEITLFNDDVYWIEMRPQEKGRYVIVKKTVAGRISDVISQQYNARTRVHEYGGGSYLVCNEGVVFCNFNDQNLHLVKHDNDVIQLTDNEDYRYADMVYDEKRRRIICVREDHSNKASEPVNTIVAISLADATDEVILVDDADFYSNPRLSPDSEQLCWISWLHPNMPWDNTTLYLARIDEQGGVVDPINISGNTAAVCQPVWSPDNKLYFISDENNWWNIYCFEGGQFECVYALDAEFAVPQWSFCEVNYAFINDHEMFAIYRQQGIARLAVVDVRQKSLHLISLPFTDYESICCNDNKACFIAASPSEFPSVIEYQIDQNEFCCLQKANSLSLDGAYISVGEALTFPVDEEGVAHAFFYRPKNKGFDGLDNEKPPLIVISHGGPTGESHNGLKMMVQFFTSRGFAILDVNYGGSSGYGRTYRQKLHGQWGIVDVNDCSKAALYVAEQGWVDKNRMAIRGGSAGGFTTLAALAFTDVFKAGASHYGVSDLESLAKETHKFESRYLDSLIGPYPAERDKYIKRSPIHSVDKLSCPVIFFQGLEDKIVLPNQAEMMVAALQEKEIPVAHIAYEGEQHGFRQSKNIKRTLEAEYYFYSRIFDFKLADEIEPITFL